MWCLSHLAEATNAHQDDKGGRHQQADVDESIGQRAGHGVVVLWVDAARAGHVVGGVGEVVQELDGGGDALEQVRATEGHDHCRDRRHGRRRPRALHHVAAEQSRGRRDRPGAQDTDLQGSRGFAMQGVQNGVQDVGDQSPGKDAKCLHM